MPSLSEIYSTYTPFTQIGQLSGKIMSDVHNQEGFQQFDATDFSNQFEYISENKSNLPPIILVPGIAGSKLKAINRNTGLEDMAWISDNIAKAFGNICEYMWGSMNEETGVFESFTNKYSKIEPIPGIQGCDYMVDGKLTQQASLQLVTYWGQYIKHLCKTYGYIENYNLFAFTYDWRQMSCEQESQHKFHTLIQRAKQLTGRRATIVGHSLGGILVEHYMKTHPDYEQSIKRFVAICVPFDGSSGYINQAQITGYNLQEEMLTNTVSKGVITSGGSIPCMIPITTGKFGSHSQIFIRKTKDFEEKKDKEQKDTGFQSPIYDNVEFNIKAFEGATPSVAFCIAKRICKHKMLKNETLKEELVKLQMLSKSGSIKCKKMNLKHKFNVDSLRIDKAFEKKQLIYSYDEANAIAEKTDAQWATFSWWIPNVHFPHNRPYSYTENMFIELKDGQLVFSQQFQTYLQNKTTVFPTYEEMRQFYQAKQYYSETLNKYGPWQSPLTRKGLTEQSIYQLVDFVHEPGTMDRALYQISRKPYNDAHIARNLPMPIPQKQKFKFYSIVGRGNPTPLHAVYCKPVKKYSELQYEQPHYVYAEGDGTVLTTSQLSDPFPENVVGERRSTVCTHFEIVSDEKQWPLFDYFIGIGKEVK
uniref:Lecithin:cholesterol acyltransferase family protein n=1 Tax=Trepomonas sp. PC1 TaxID=1076344 RepID=A0A146KEC0_9EUKA|eukprot:JAP94244.1 hypothetical protein TPC1_13183 [Trepomonas sp. PC1]